ncbi:MAG: hypothetical protein ACI9TV_000244 [Sulfurimonas sp.]|jgi:hypothetical protein|uniref:hypothetical protein n=1 Tax=Sulfurimonas sp. TaxID=2022749 RepID=UPI0039E509EE
MKSNILKLVVISGLFVTLQASSDGSYFKKVQKERDRISDKRDLKAEARRWNNDFDKMLNRRAFIDKSREIRTSIRKEVQRIF